MGAVTSRLHVVSQSDSVQLYLHSEIIEEDTFVGLHAIASARQKIELRIRFPASGMRESREGEERRGS